MYVSTHADWSQRRKVNCWKGPLTPEIESKARLELELADPPVSNGGRNAATSTSSSSSSSAAAAATAAVLAQAQANGAGDEIRVRLRSVHHDKAPIYVSDEKHDARRMVVKAHGRPLDADKSMKSCFVIEIVTPLEQHVAPPSTRTKICTLPQTCLPAHKKLVMAAALLYDASAATSTTSSTSSPSLASEEDIRGTGGKEGGKEDGDDGASYVQQIGLNHMMLVDSSRGIELPLGDGFFAATSGGLSSPRFLIEGDVVHLCGVLTVEPSPEEAAALAAADAAGGGGGEVFIGRPGRSSFSRSYHHRRESRRMGNLTRAYERCLLQLPPEASPKKAHKFIALCDDGVQGDDGEGTSLQCACVLVLTPEGRLLLKEILVRSGTSSAGGIFSLERISLDGIRFVRGTASTTSATSSSSSSSSSSSGSAKAAAPPPPPSVPASSGSTALASDALDADSPRSPRVSSSEERAPGKFVPLTFGPDILDRRPGTFVDRTMNGGRSTSSGFRRLSPEYPYEEAGAFVQNSMCFLQGQVFKQLAALTEQHDFDDEDVYLDEQERETIPRPPPTGGVFRQGDVIARLPEGGPRPSTTCSFAVLAATAPPFPSIANPEATDYALFDHEYGEHPRFVPRRRGTVERMTDEWFDNHVDVHAGLDDEEENAELFLARLEARREVRASEDELLGNTLRRDRVGGVNTLTRQVS